MPTLEWIGKEKVINHHQDVPFRLLDKKYTFNAESSENMIIHGDNLLALKSLLSQYEGRVDCIYIDPPYNTRHKRKNFFVSRCVDSSQFCPYNNNVLRLFPSFINAEIGQSRVFCAEYAFNVPKTGRTIDIIEFAWYN